MAVSHQHRYNLYGKNFTFKGMKFPWCSTYAGVEQCMGNTETHLQGDIALAFLQHWWTTHNTTWLVTTGYPLILGLADFYASRVVRNSDHTFSIARTMGPDEYHGNVTDSVYGNAIARLTLQAAASLATAAGAQPNQTYADIANGLRIMYDPALDYHPEYAGYGALLSLTPPPLATCHVRLGLSSRKRWVCCLPCTMDSPPPTVTRFILTLNSAT
jgi:hypothetical protein